MKKLFVYSVVGPKDNIIGYAAKVSNEEALGHAVNKFIKDNTGEPITSASVMEIEPAHIVAHLQQNMNPEQPPTVWDNHQRN